MNKVVSIHEIEKAFDQLVQSINLVEDTVKNQTEIEINEMTIAQIEKIVYLNSCLSTLNMSTDLAPRSKFHFVLGSNG